MKKSIFLIIAVLAIMVLALVGCSGKVKADTVAKTQEIWDTATNKEATDVITIKNFSFAKLVTIENAVFTIERKFEENKTTINLTLNAIKVKFDSSSGVIFNVILNMVKQQAGITSDITMEDIRNILDNIEEFKVQFILTENNSKLEYNITSKVNYKKPTYDKDIKGNLDIETSAEYDDVIGQSMNLLTSHFTSFIEPTTDGGAKINPTKINNILTAFINIKEANDPNKDTEGYVPISKQITNILGVPYNQFISKKVKVNDSKSQCTIKKNLITEMKISLSKVQVLYNKEQLTNVIIKAVELISPNDAGSVGALKTFLKDITEGVSCIETEFFMINSTYKISK